MMSSLTINLPFFNSNSNSNSNPQFKSLSSSNLYLGHIRRLKLLRINSQPVDATPKLLSSSSSNSNSNPQFKSLSSSNLYLGHIRRLKPLRINSQPVDATPKLLSSSYFHSRISGVQPPAAANSSSKSNSNSKSFSHIRRVSSQCFDAQPVDPDPPVTSFDAQPVDPDLPVASFDAQPVVLPIAVFDDIEEDPHFNRFHLLRHNKLMLQPQLFLKDNNNNNNNNHSLTTVDHQNLLWKEHPNLHRHSFCFVGHGSYLLAGCCDNLVLVYFYDVMDVRGESGLPREALWNITTNQLKFLPWRQHRTLTDAHVRSYGFGFDHASQDYKVVKFLLFDYDDYSGTDGSEYIELYSLKSDSWKKITLKSDIWKEISSRPAGNIRPYSEPSIHINGFYYWKAYVEEPIPFIEDFEFILSFDFANEKFSNIPKPYKEGFSRIYFLVEYDNSLAAVLLSKYEKQFSFEIWVWGGESWTARVPQVDVPAYVQYVVCLFENDKLFLHSWKNELLLFNIATRELENLGIHADPSRLFGCD